MLNICQLLATHQISPHGVIHIGAHEGEELEEYLKIGFKKIVFVEANPTVFARLMQHVAGRAEVTCVCCAIGDHIGEATFNVTSMDQSSSLLPLKLHDKLYPSIKVTEQIKVPLRTLDDVFMEKGWRPADFNFLHLDIQGAELLALRGAEKCLQHVEAINTEVNLAELYDGCALLPQLEDFMAARGFNRAAMACPYHPTWGDAFYVRRPVFTMKTLGRNGRFANQLFQYLYLRLCAQRHGAIVQTPQWAGKALFGIDDPEPIRQLPIVDEASLPAPETMFNGKIVTPGDIDFYGWYQLHSAHFRPHRDFIRNLFRPLATLQRPLDAIVNRLRAGGRPLVALHLRRGDYGYNHFFRAPCCWYRRWLEQLDFGTQKPVIYLCSDEPLRVRGAFDGWDVMSFGDLRDIPADLAYIIDFHILTQADIVATANSSYSFIASMLNQRAKLFVRPNLDTAQVEPFDPWNAPVLLTRKLHAGEQAALDALDQQLVQPTG